MPSLNGPPFDKGEAKSFQDHFQDSVCDSLVVIDEVLNDLVGAVLVPVELPGKESWKRLLITHSSKVRQLPLRKQVRHTCLRHLSKQANRLQSNKT